MRLAGKIGGIGRSVGSRLWEDLGVYRKIGGSVRICGRDWGKVGAAGGFGGVWGYRRHLRGDWGQAGSVG